MQSGSIVKTATSALMTIKSIEGDVAVCTWFIDDKVSEQTFAVSDLIDASPEEIKSVELEKFEQALKDRAAELSAANGGKKVIPVWYLDPVDPDNGRPIIGYLMEPNRATKGGIMDTFAMSMSRAQGAALQASIMKDVSDDRITSTSFLYDAVNMKAAEEALSLIRIAVSQFKKK